MLPVGPHEKKLEALVEWVREETRDGEPLAVLANFALDDATLQGHAVVLHPLAFAGAELRGTVAQAVVQAEPPEQLARPIPPC